jgi:hypothetical protein
MSARVIVTGAMLASSVLLNSGCQSLGTASGAVAGVATGAATSNPAVGFGVGIAVQTAIDETVDRTMRRLHKDQQDAMALLVGEMLLDETRPWRVKNWLPVENGHGQIRVTRVFESALAQCKEFAFSVVDGDKPGADETWYMAAACQTSQGWQWASAEPAVGRWGNLQ